MAVQTFSDYVDNNGNLLIQCCNISLALLIVKVALYQFLHHIKPSLKVLLHPVDAVHFFRTLFSFAIIFAAANREHLPDVHQVLFDFRANHLEVQHFLSLSLFALSDQQALPLVVLYDLHLQVEAPH